MTENKKTYNYLDSRIIANVGKFFDQITPMDVDIIYLDKYRIIKEDGIIDMVNCDKVGGQFIYARDVCINNSKVCEAFALEAKRRLDKEESLAFLDRAREALKKYVEPKIDKKSGEETYEFTDGKCNQYVKIDDEVIKLKELHDSWEILADYFSKYSAFFDKCNEWVRDLIRKEMKMISSNNIAS